MSTLSSVRLSTCEKRTACLHVHICAVWDRLQHLVIVDRCSTHLMRCVRLRFKTENRSQLMSI